jgi:probable F420-dependent oxidoreductase
LKVGAVFSQADSGTDPVAIRRFATEVEAAGYHHLMAYDHILGVPASMFPGPVGNFPSAPYTDEHPFHEVLVLLSHLAAVTTTLDFVTSVFVVPQRQTAVAAKQIATIDLLSGGRLHVAVGVGWNNVEYGALGADFATRTRRLAEQIAVMKRLWTEPLVTFDGEFHHLDHVGVNPLPSRPIPVWMGTNATDAALRRVVAQADGWMPLIVPGLDPVGVAAGVSRLRQLCEEAGRDPATMPVWWRVYLVDGWQGRVEEARTLECTHFSVGAPRGVRLDDQLATIVGAKAEVESLLAGE